MSDIKNPICSIQILRAVAALLVVLGHILSRLNHIYGQSDFMAFYDSIYSFGVDLFFVISGFIMITISKEKKYTIAEALYFIKKRYIRIYPIYWIALSGFIILLIIQSKIAPNSLSLERLGNWTFLVKSFFLIPVQNPTDSFFPLLQVGWTLIFEIFFYSMFFICLLVARSHKGRFSLLCIFFIALVFLNQLSEASSNVFLVYYGSLIVCEFLLGCLIAIIMAKHQNHSERVGFLILLLGGAMFFLSGFLPNEFKSDHLADIRFIKWGIPAALILYGALTLERFASKAQKLVVLGDSSYSLYLFHTAIILPVTAEFFSIFGLYEYLGIYLTTLIFLFLCVFLSFFIHKCIERPVTIFFNGKFLKLFERY